MAPSRKRTVAKQDVLTNQDRKQNHVAAEKKRREAIRRGFDIITAVVPDLHGDQSRSEALVLEKSVDLVRNLITENEELQKLAKEHQLKPPAELHH